MVSESFSSLSRRQVLAAGGAAFGTLGLVDSGSGSGSNADDPGGWPMVRHDPGGTSYAPETSGPVEDVEVRWKTPVDTHFGPSAQPCPIVAGGIVYAVGDGLTAVAADTGDVLFRLDPAFGTSPAVVGARAYHTPTVALPKGRQVVGVHGGGGVSVGGRELGRTRWTAGGTSNQSYVDGLIEDMLGSTATPPVVVEETVLAYLEDALAAIDASSGSVRWRSDECRGRPVVRNGTVYVLGRDWDLLSIDLETGESTEFVSDLAPRSMVATASRLFVMTHDHLLGVSTDGTVEWRYAPSDYSLDETTLAVGDGVAYVGADTDDGGRFLAIDATTGSLLWERPVTVDHRSIPTPPAVTDEMAYLPTEGGALVGVHRADGSVRWRFESSLEYVIWSAVAVADGTIYAIAQADQGHLFALEEP